MKLLYYPEDKYFTRNVFLVGKGVTYDTGGHDLKTGGNMALMHRDKCGAGVVAGIFKTISLLKPARTRVRVFCIGYSNYSCFSSSVGWDAFEMSLGPMRT